MSAAAWPVDVHPQFGCWLWRDAIDDAGYAIVWRGGRPLKAYLLVYTAEVGPIPPGLVLDHACRVRACVRAEGGPRGWSHLEAVSQSENLKRRSWRYRVRRMQCTKGHPWPLNAMVVGVDGGRLCRQCMRDATGGSR